MRSLVPSQKSLMRAWTLGERACYSSRTTQSPCLPAGHRSPFAPFVTIERMPSGRSTRPLAFALALLFVFVCARAAAAQDEFEDDAADPVKLFNKGQDAHAKKQYEQALEFYDEALKLKPDFAEVEFQKAGALVALRRAAEAERSYRRAMELKPTWPLPPAALGLLLARTPGRE